MVLKLHSAIRKIVSEQGRDFLLDSKKFLNSLNDYQSFRDNQLLRKILSTSLSLSCIESILSLGKKRSSIFNIFSKQQYIVPDSDRIQQEKTLFATKIAKEFPDNPLLVSYVFDSVIYGLGWNQEEPKIPQESTTKKQNTIETFENLEYLMKLPVISSEHITSKPIKEIQYLIIEVSPKNAEIYVDGNRMKSEDGMVITEVSLDQHKYSVCLSGYKTQTGYVLVDKSEKARVTVQLKPLITTAKVKVSMTTPGTEVFIDGKSYGTDSFEVELKSGKHNISAKKENCKDYNSTITVKAEGEYSICIPKLGRLYGGLNIKVFPIDSSILVNGQLRGTTPFVISKIPAGKVDLLVITKKGNKYSKTVEIKPDMMTNVEYTIDDNSSNV